MTKKPGKYKKLLGWDQIEKVIDVDQSPIGRTPRSNPATYTGVFDDIRALFAQTNAAKMRGYTKARFSFNIKGGRCEACHGDGIIKIEMNFCLMCMSHVKFAMEPVTILKLWKLNIMKKI